MIRSINPKKNKSPSTCFNGRSFSGFKLIISLKILLPVIKFKGVTSLSG